MRDKKRTQEGHQKDGLIAKRPCLRKCEIKGTEPSMKQSKGIRNNEVEENSSERFTKK